MKRSMEELVLLARKGDQEAISELYEQTYNSVYQSVRAIMKDEEEALDVVQDSYIKGFQNLDKLETPEKYQAWMKQIAANQARDYLRKKRPVLFSERVNQEGEELDLQQPDECLEHMPDEVIDRQETTRLMNDILSTLSEEQRLAICMFYYEDQSVKEIAAALNCSENTVKSRLNYGRKKIEVAVKALEKQGTKIYSLAPLPFFLWLLRMAKGYGISAQVVAGTSAAGMAGAAAAAGETAAAASGTTAAGTAVGSSVATKVVAGVLAVSLTAGAGVAIANSANLEKENEVAHIVYEELLDKHKAFYELSYPQMLAEENQFWVELGENLLEKYPEDLEKALAKDEDDETMDRVLMYPAIGETEFEEGVPMPQTAFDPIFYPHYHDFTYEYWEGEQIYVDQDAAILYGYYDFDENGIDELVMRIVPNRADGRSEAIQIFAINDGYLCCGLVNYGSADGETIWEITPFGGAGNYTVHRDDGYYYPVGIDFYVNLWYNEETHEQLLQDTYPEPKIEYQHLCG